MDESAAAGIDVSKPSIARVYDAYLGGKDNFAVDRAVLDEHLKVVPAARDTAYANRGILGRGVRYLAAEVGVRQFLDLGAGLPTMDNTHQVAQRVDPDARVAYVDNDPIVLAHGRALLDNGDQTAVITADLGDVEGVLGHPDVRRLIDFTEPVAVLLVGMLHHFHDDQDPGGIAKAYMDAVPSGSHLFITHFCRSGSQAVALEEAFLAFLGTGRFRTLEEIEQYFEGLELVEPGVTYLPTWRPDKPLHELTVVDTLMAGGIGRKP